MSFMKKPKAPIPSAQEQAITKRQTIALDKEIEEQEQRFKALARGKLGSASLLGGAPRSRSESARGARGSAGGAGGSGRSMLGGIASGATGGGIIPANMGDVA